MLFFSPSQGMKNVRDFKRKKEEVNRNSYMPDKSKTRKIPTNIVR